MNEELDLNAIFQSVFYSPPGTTRLEALRKDGPKADAFLRGPETGEEARIIRCNLFRERGHVHRKAGRLDKACARYGQAIAAIAGKDVAVPLPVTDELGGVVSKVYKEFTSWERVDVMACCNAMADCMLESKNIAQALIWLIEVDVLNKSMFLANPTPVFEWLSISVNIEEHFAQCITEYVKLSQIYLELGNTGNAVHKIWIGTTIMQEVPSSIDKTKLKRLIPTGKVKEITQLRHPDSQLSSKLTFANSELQIRGSWKKLSIRKTEGMSPRMGFASFVWNGFLYVAGGEKGLDGPFYRDFWRLSLSSLGAWEPLAPYPTPESMTGHFFSWSMAVCDDKAYLFTGRLSLDVFDLKSGAWSTVATRFNPRTGSSKWFYPTEKLTEYTMQIVGKTMYVFGGVHSAAALGCNLLLSLNLETLQWEHLSGTAEPVADFDCPGPRRYASSWVDDARGRLMIMFGEADRIAAKRNGRPNGAFTSYGYDDLWSWDIRGRRWRRERILGNAPCPRSEMASTWNEKLNHAVVFGGYSPTIPTAVEEANETFTFSYYADTFIWDASASPPNWKQLLTHGFPTYRAQSQLFSDPLTGKTFLFGGFTNLEFVPSRKHCISRSFGDLWQLRIDQPGGYFEGVDLAEEARTARAGPYRRCFTCGGAGSWKQCGGSCNGRAFFCDPECFKEGWKEHKKRHGCQKKA